MLALVAKDSLQIVPISPATLPASHKPPDTFVLLQHAVTWLLPGLQNQSIQLNSIARTEHILYRAQRYTA